MSKTKLRDTDFLFLSAYIAAKSTHLLNENTCARMLDAASFAECAKLLEACGYPDVSGLRAEQIDAVLAAHRDEVFAELAQLSPCKALVDVFRCKYDYHNAKALIKAEGANVDGAYLLSGAGRVEKTKLMDAYHEENYGALPEKLGKAVEAARGILARTENPQLADFALDRAYFEELSALAGETGSEFLIGYVKVMIDSANLRSAVRTLRMGRGADFLRQALIPGGDCGTAQILASAASAESLAGLFGSGRLRRAAELVAEAVGGSGLTAFEKACDNCVSGYLAGASMQSFGEAPVIAYIAAVENEIAAARMILTGRLSGVSAERIKERLREMNA